MAVYSDSGRIGGGRRTSGEYRKRFRFDRVRHLTMTRRDGRLTEIQNFVQSFYFLSKNLIFIRISFELKAVPNSTALVAEHFV